MKIKYNINLGNYIANSNFNSIYTKEIILNNKYNIISSKIELLGYFPYKLFDDEDEKRVKEKYKKELKEYMDNIIYKMKNQVENAINILSKNKNIKSIELYPYTDSEFTIYTSIENFK